MGTLLVVDDEDAVIYAILQTLEDSGHRVVTAINPSRALELLKGDLSIDLLITDLFMPEMDGATLLQCSRRIRPGLKVVLTTGAASEQEVRRWRRRGEVIVQKPWLAQELVSAIETALGRKDDPALRQ